MIQRHEFSLLSDLFRHSQSSCVDVLVSGGIYADTSGSRGRGVDFWSLMFRLDMFATSDKYISYRISIAEYYRLSRSRTRRSRRRRYVGEKDDDDAKLNLHTFGPSDVLFMCRRACHLRTPEEEEEEEDASQREKWRGVEGWN